MFIHRTQLEPRLLTVLAALHVVIQTSCGGDVTSSSGGGGAQSSSSSTSSGAPDPAVVGAQACADVCHKLEVNACDGAPQDCAAFCDGQLADAGICANELAHLYTCWLPIAPACPNAPPPACKAEEDTYEACVAVYGCVSNGCSGGVGPNGATTCSCSQTCAMKEYATSCATDATGTTCDCLVDNVSLGTCHGDADLTCDINQGCCASLFNK